MGENAFRGCEALRSAAFTGAATADYYGADEPGPSFPEGCRVNAAPGGGLWCERWEREKSAPSSAAASAGEAKDEPYYWTQALTDRDYTGSGIYADVTLHFDGTTAAVRVNGRDFDEAAYSADANDDEQLVRTDGLYCRDGRLQTLRFEYHGAGSWLTAELDCGGTTRSVVFLHGSEEQLYLPE